MKIPLSVLDLVPVGAGTSAAGAVRHIVDLAQLAERMGYARLWYAEHHSMPSVASSAPEILIAHAAAHTSKIRVGSGGVMLPNHAPLRTAELFRTLAALHPDRIDLGLGRAPGSDPTATRALRASNGEDFPQLITELLTWSGEAELPADLPPHHPIRRLKAMPGDAPLPPIWILGSSGASARLAGASGFGYSFASHFSPTPAAPAFRTYRESFEPSANFPEPHAILGAAVVCADTADEADYLASAMDLAWARLRSGVVAPLPTPEEALAHEYTEGERRLVADFRRLAVIGTPEHVRGELEERAHACGANEIMISTNMHNPKARLRSFELIAQAFAER